jgi:hypothetical protein
VVLPRPTTLAYALLVLPVYAVLIALNLVLIAGPHPDLAGADRRRMFRESGLPGLPFELVYGILATLAVLAWSRGTAPRRPRRRGGPPLV